MHMMDCKGVTATVLGGLLHYLLTNVLLGSNRDIRLATINAKMKEWYDAHPGSHRIPRILMGNTTLNGWAELHGPAIKAANTRSAVGPFKAIWAEYARADDELDSNASVVINSLATFYDILYTAPMFMSDECIERLQVVCITFGGAYLRCREHARRANVLVWPVKMKAHKMQHVPMMCRVINPICIQCYADESLIGTTTKVWKRSIAGRYHNFAQRNVLLKRLVALLVRFHAFHVGRPSA